MSTRTRRQPGIAGAVMFDLRRLHEEWMELLFPRQRGQGHPVMGKWRPKTGLQKVAYYGWGAIGLFGLLVLYPLTVLGLATRYHARKLDSTATRIGILGVLAVCIVVWGALTVVAHLQLPFRGFLAVLTASAVATVSATLAYVTKNVGGRISTILLAYPFAVTAVFLPPVVAAFQLPALEEMVFGTSEELAIFILDEILFVMGINEWIRATFDLEGLGFALMWLALSFVVGWFLGLLVGLANVIRPRSPTEDEGSDGGESE